MSGICRDCVRGSVHSGTPTGTEATIHNVPTYVARPEGTPKGLIVIIPDLFGWEFTNSRVLADQYAKKGGYTVYIPDVMKGHGASVSLLGIMDSIMAPASLMITIFMKPYYILQALARFVPALISCRRSIVKPRILDFFQALRTSPETSNMKIGVAGFCWGGQYVFLLAGDTPSSRVHRVGSQAGQVQSLVDAAFTAHPSMVQVPKDAEAVTIPLSIAVGDKDIAMPERQVLQCKEILEKKKAGDHEVVVYPGATHGFAVRGDPRDPNQKDKADKAEVQALEWFARWLG